MSALAGAVTAPFSVRQGGIDAMRWLRAGLSLALAVGILALALPAAFGAGAHSAGVDPLRVFSSGPAVSVSADGGARLSVSGLVPGQSRTSMIRLSNRGSGPAALSLAARMSDRVAPGGVPLSSVLDLRIAAGGAVLYNGSLSDLHRLPLGGIDAGASRLLRFTVTLPDSIGNEVQGSMLSASFAWTAG